MSSRSKGKKRNLDEVIDGAILGAKVAKEAGESVPVLSPLKASMGIVITLLENLKVGYIPYTKALFQSVYLYRK
jgi:hypothetical protein